MNKGTMLEMSSRKPGFSRVLIAAVGVSLFCITVLGCGRQARTEVPDIDIELDVQLTHEQMISAIRALQDSGWTMQRAYQTYLSQNRDFYLELLGVMPNQINQTPSPTLLDSIIIQNLEPLLSDSNMYFLADTLSEILPSDFDLAGIIAPPLKRLVAAFGKDQILLPAFRTHINGYIPDGDIYAIDQLQILPDYFSFGMHFFLGQSFPYYPVNVPAYVRKRYQLPYLPVLMTHEIAEGMVPQVDPAQQPTLLDKMIREGIKLYMIDQLLPDTQDSLKIFYSPAQWEWATYYEANIYKELIPHLYNTDFNVHRDFLQEKPFTSHLGESSAPRLGQFIGWQIVAKYMEKQSGMSLAALSESTSYEEIFKASGYKP